VNLTLVGIAIWIGSGMLSLPWRRKVTGCRLAAAGMVAGALCIVFPALHVVSGAPPVKLRYPWAVPYGELFFELDALSAWFVLPICGLAALAAIYGIEYLGIERKRASSGAHWFFYNLLAASMVLVVLARNALLFLVLWEVMTLASFFLITLEDDAESTHQAGWIYLVATHLGTAFLLAFFLILGRHLGTLDFEQWAGADSLSPGTAGLLFILALIGFGTKAGFVPLHVWLPEAHPAAPSHVSAVMSGVMIKAGIYGLLRALTFLGPPENWWGLVLVGVGLSSGILGVLFALAQHDLKRLLAYHSVENIGIIALGMGIGLIGLASNLYVMAVLGFAGALWHVLNHALFKGLLFLGAGSIASATATRDMERLGGLIKRMPWTALSFLVGAVAIAGLPPLNGFVSELLVYVGAYHAVTEGEKSWAIAGLATLAGLALIGGLAAACFAKAFGIVFLGEPRSASAMQAHENGPGMRWPMILLAAACVLIGLLAPIMAGVLEPALGIMMPGAQSAIAPALIDMRMMLTRVVAVASILLALVLFLALMRARLLAKRRVQAGVTWDCGYALPSARMQYTASSFAQPLTHLFKPLLKPVEYVQRPDGILPLNASLKSETHDLCHGNLYEPAFIKLNWGLSKVKWLQHGNVHIYVLYIALTLIALLVWKLR
jgi:hydrogenase-4 component B